MALGADAGRVRRLVVTQGAVLASIGLTLGIVGAIAVTRVLAALLYGIGTRDPATFVTVALFLSIVALAASGWAARRATRVDPMVALRTE